MGEGRREVQGDHDLIEIRDPSIDVDAIMRRVREGVERRRRDGLLPDKQFPRFGVSLMPEEPAGEHDVELYYHLQRANDTCADIGVDLSLADSPFTTLPVIGRLWSLVRRQVHGLIVYYLGLQSRKQVRVNTHIVSTMNRLAAQCRRQSDEIAALRSDVERLSQELGRR